MILQLIKPSIVEQIARKCEDPYFNDFERSEYEEAIFFADKLLALRYKILHQCFNKEFFITTPPGENETDYLQKILNEAIALPIKNIDFVNDVIINSKQYSRELPAVVSQDGYQYSLETSSNELLFNYSPRANGDNVYIYYTSTIVLEDYDDYSAPIIPARYEEERIKLATRNIAERGYAKFKEDKEKKYGKILSLNKDRGTKPELMEYTGPKRIKPFKYP